MPIYDDQKTSDDQLRDVTGIGKDEEARMEQRAGNDGRTQDTAAPGGKVFGGNPAEKKKGGDDKNPLSASALKDKESKVSGGAGEKAAEAAVSAVGGGAAMAGMKILKLMGLRKKKRLGLLGGLVTAVIITVSIVGVFTALPLKVIGMTTNLQNIFFANVDDAASRMDDNFLRHYLIQKVVPGMKEGKCKTTRVNKSCAKISKDGNIVQQMYRAWSDNNLEGKLATDYGIEIQQRGTHYYLRSGQLNQDLDLGSFGSVGTRDFEDKAYAALSKNDIRQILRGAFEGETLSKQIRYKVSVGRLLERKYGIKRCVFACEDRDKLSDGWAKATAEVKGRAAKLVLTDRVSLPYSEFIGLTIECSTQGFTCAELAESNADGERLTKYQTDLQARAQAYRGQFADDETKLKALDDAEKEIHTKGFVQFIVKRLFGETAAKTVGVLTEASNPAGWVLMVANATAGAAVAGPALIHMAYVINSQAMVQVFSVYRTFADEQKSGRLDLSILGSMADSLGQVKGSDQGDCAADQSPSYNALINQDKTAFNSNGFMAGGKADAATATSCKCNNGKSYSPGKLVCDEVSFTSQTNIAKIANVLSDITKFTAGAGGVFLSKLITNVTNSFFDSLSKLVGLDKLSEAIGKFISANFGDFLKWITDFVMPYFIPQAVTANMSGARIWELMMGGADVAGNDYARYGQGGEALTDVEVSQIRADAAADRQYAFNQKSVKDKLFDTSDSLSGLSQVAMAIPSSNGTIVGRFGSVLGGMWNISASSLASLIGLRTAFAGTTRISPDPTGVTQNGYPRDDYAFSADPSVAYDTLKCADPTDPLKINGETNMFYGNQATEINKNTGIAESKVLNRCKLYRSEISSAGGKDDSSLLEAPLQDTAAGCGANTAPTALNSLKVELQRPPFGLSSPQGAFQDQTTCSWYLIQAIARSGSGEDLRISQYSQTGQYVNSMTLDDGGHGLAVGLEHDTDGTYIWTTYGYQLGPDDTAGDMYRIHYEPGVWKKSSANVHKVDIFHNRAAYVSIDQKNDLIAFRYNNAASTVVRRLSDVKNGVDKVVCTGSGIPEMGVLEGFTVAGDSLFFSTEHPGEETKVYQYDCQKHKKISEEKYDFLPFSVGTTKGDFESGGLQATSDGIVIGFRVFSGQDRLQREFKIAEPPAFTGGD